MMIAVAAIQGDDAVVDWWMDVMDWCMGGFLTMKHSLFCMEEEEVQAVANNSVEYFI